MQVKVEQGGTQRQRTVVVVAAAAAAAEAVADAGNLRMRHTAAAGTLQLHIPMRRIGFICSQGTRQGVRVWWHGKKGDRKCCTST